MKSLIKFPEKCGGEAYFVTEDTPSGTYNALCEPFIRAAGFKYTSISVPSRMFLMLLYILEIILTIFSPFVKFNLPATPSTTIMVNLNSTFTRRKLETKCSFSPIYSYAEALKRSIPYYTKVIKR